MKGGEAMKANKIATFVGSVPAGICRGRGEWKWGGRSHVWVVKRR